MALVEADLSHGRGPSRERSEAGGLRVSLGGRTAGNTAVPDRAENLVGSLLLRRVTGVGQQLELSQRNGARVGAALVGVSDPVSVAPTHERRNLDVGEA